MRYEEKRDVKGTVSGMWKWKVTLFAKMAMPDSQHVP